MAFFSLITPFGIEGYQTNRIKDACYTMKGISAQLVQLISRYLDLFQEFSQELYHYKVEKALREV